MRASATDRIPSQPDEGLYRRLVWLTLLRITLVTLLLGASAFVVLKSDARDELGAVEQILYGVIVGAYVASLGYLLVLRRSPRMHRALAYAQVTGDVLIAACLVYLTGGAESVIVFMFPLTVVSAAVLLYRRGAVAAAVLSTGAMALVAWGVNSGRFPAADPNLTPAVLSTPRLLFFLFANAAAIFLTAALASYLAEQLRQSRENLTRREQDYASLALLTESIVRSISSGICAADRFGRISFLNPAGEQITGLALGRVRGEPVERHFPALAGRLHGQEPDARFEADFVCQDGTRRQLGFAIAPLVGRDADEQGWVVAFQDLTSMRAMEETVKRAERLAAVGAMAAGLAHELRNPLASMSGSVQLLADNKALSEDEQRLLSIVLREADRLNRLVTDFLRFARPAPPTLRPLDLAGLVEETLALFRNDPERRAVEIVAELAGPLPVQGDPAQLKQVLWNLFANAAESMAGGGRLRIVGERVEGRVRVKITDAGQGIAPEDLRHIFDPFFTTKEKGSGLGLATVHAVVSSHGGEVTVVSERGRGSTFMVELPAKAETLARAAGA